MARDSQAALIALNRFGFGARGGASGDLINAASDPRGFVKSELNRPDAVRLELPGLQATPALAQAVFAYQEEMKAKRETAAKTTVALDTNALCRLTNLRTRYWADAGRARIGSCARYRRRSAPSSPAEV